MTNEGSYLSTSEMKEHMLVIGLSFVFARWGGKYSLIMKAWVQLTMSFGTMVALSCLDLFAHVTVINGGLAIMASAMVESSGLVINLQGST